MDVSRGNETRVGLGFLKAYTMIWDVPAGTAVLIPRSLARESRKALGLPDIPPEPGLVEPHLVKLEPAVWNELQRGPNGKK